MKKISLLSLIILSLSCTTPIAKRNLASVLSQHSCQEILSDLTKTVSPFGFGKLITYKSQSQKSTKEISHLKIGSYNVENFLDDHGNEKLSEEFLLFTTGPKYFEKKKQISNEIKKLNPDILFIQEMGPESELKKLAESPDLLNGVWIPFMLKGNDSRIDVAILIKKDLPFNLEIHSFTEKIGSYMGQEVKVFNRDFPVMVLKDNQNKPMMIMAGVHYKAQLAKPNDPKSTIRRGLEVEQSSEILKLVKEKYGTEIPIMVVGDFNNTFTKAPEFEPLKKIQLKDAFNLAPPINRKEQIVTNIYIERDTSSKDIQTFKHDQTDSILVSPDIEVLKTGIQRYEGAKGEPLPYPNTLSEFKMYPSDHFPIYSIINFEKILKLQ